MTSFSIAPLGKESTGQDVIDFFGGGLLLEGKTCVVTGTSSGIGAEAARVFANAGAMVFALGRNAEKTQAVADSINAECGGAPRVRVVPCDLGSLASVRAAAATILAEAPAIHVLLNNAGIGFTPRRLLTADGLEAQFGTNHVGHFALTNLLRGALIAAAPARVVNVSSMAHLRGPPDFADLNWERSYDEGRSYGASKTCNILHAVALNARLGAAGVTACSLHPGVIATELWRHGGIVFPDNKTIAQGAATSVYCALAPDIKGGGYYSDCEEARAREYAVDPHAAEQLWTATEAILSGL